MSLLNHFHSMLPPIMLTMMAACNVLSSIRSQHTDICVIEAERLRPCARLAGKACNARLGIRDADLQHCRLSMSRYWNGRPFIVELAIRSIKRCGCMLRRASSIVHRASVTSGPAMSSCLSTTSNVISPCPLVVLRVHYLGSRPVILVSGME